MDGQMDACGVNPDKAQMLEAARAAIDVLKDVKKIYGIWDMKTTKLDSAIEGLQATMSDGS